MKILAIDIGNTRTRFATVEDRKVLESSIFPTGDVDGITQAFKTLQEPISDKKPLPAVICSVVPKLCDHLEEVGRLALDIEPFIIGKNIPLPLKTDLKDTHRVGPDRVVAAAMAYERMKNAVVVASFGTGITIDCVNSDGIFLGGAILPGLATSTKALEEHTAMLPLVELKLPETPWGRNTEEAISAGVIYGAVGALREIVERYANQLGRWPELIVTGGDAELLAKNCDFIHAVVPELLLMGIELTYDYYFQQQQD
ncbi:MAG: type III pantothenate kinase [Phycisphaerae bacterium]